MQGSAEMSTNLASDILWGGGISDPNKTNFGWGAFFLPNFINHRRVNSRVVRHIADLGSGPLPPRP